MRDHRRLRLVAASPPAVCRTRGCGLPSDGPLGFCTPCEAVYDAARELYERRLVAAWARVAPAWRSVLAGLCPTHREELRAHIAAHAENGGTGVRAIEDFFAALADRLP
jgi:hypothetical protein